MNIDGFTVCYYVRSLGDSVQDKKYKAHSVKSTPYIIRYICFR